MRTVLRSWKKGRVIRRSSYPTSSYAASTVYLSLNRITSTVLQYFNEIVSFPFVNSKINFGRQLITQVLLIEAILRYNDHLSVRLMRSEIYRLVSLV